MNQKLKLVLHTPFVLLLIVFGVGQIPQPRAAMLNDRPLALASGDFDEDGAPDLVCAYAGDGGGRIEWRRGNPAAVYPRGAAIGGASTDASDSPFFAPRSTPIAMSPDFIGAGDFDADGHLDLVVAARGDDKLGWI